MTKKINFDKMSIFIDAMNSGYVVLIDSDPQGPGKSVGDADVDPLSVPDPKEKTMCLLVYCGCWYEL